MWTEVATGREARSFRRWLRRVASPILTRHLFLLLVAFIWVTIYGCLLFAQELHFATILD